MKAISVITLVLNLFTMPVFAQDGSVGIQAGSVASSANETKAPDTSKHNTSGQINIFLSGGVGLPLGKYSTSYFDYVSSNGIQGKVGFNGLGGFAQVGIASSLMFEIPVKQSSWGIVALAGFNMNKFNMADYAYGYSYTPNAYYRSLVVMPGVYTEFAGDNVSLEFRALVGVLISQSPEIQYHGDSIYADLINSKQDTESIYKDIKPVVAFAFAFDLGISLRFNISSKLLLTVNADYEQAYPTYLANEVYAKSGSDVSSFTSIYCPISLFNATVGIGYRFGKK